MQVTSVSKRRGVQGSRAVKWAGLFAALVCVSACGCAEQAAEEDAAADRAPPPPLFDMAWAPDPEPPPPQPDRGVPDAALPDDGLCNGPDYRPPIDLLCDWRAEAPDCPDGYECRIVRNDGPDAVAVCVAPNCTDLDGDGHGVGDMCAGPDCNDCDNSVHASAPEICNGVDDNCDGDIDNAVDPNDDPMTCLGLGVCEGSQKQCRGGAWICDYPPTYEARETRCDNLDNDCDGRVDNLESLGEPCTSGAGACAQSGVWICDGISGERRCSAQPLEPVAELCNGIDDDCDGVIDNLPEVGQPCTLRSGTCESAGAWRCDPVAGQIACSAPPPEPRDEIRDGRDNDCDGLIDEGLPPVGEVACDNRDDDGDGTIDEDLTEPCQGACGAGERRCLAGEWQACDAPDGGPEICNQRDDDCDGQTDEGLPRNACGGCGEAREICDNGLDDDCDGVIDNPAICDCSGEPDGTVVHRGAPGPCGGFADGCAEDGTQTRIDQVCQNGASVERQVMDACRRDTGGQPCLADGFAGQCANGACRCTPQLGAWRCADAATRVRDDGCGDQERAPCANGERCAGGVCACQPDQDNRCIGDEVHSYDSCGQGRFIELCEFGCLDGQCIDCMPRWSAWRCADATTRERDDGCEANERDPCRHPDRCVNGECECQPQWGPWQCLDNQTARQSDGCGNHDQVVCDPDEACENGACAPCCEMRVSPRINAWTGGALDTEACGAAGGGYLYDLRVTDIRFAEGRDEMTAVADIEVRKLGGGPVGGDLTVWVVLVGDERDLTNELRCADRGVYERRRDLNGRLIEPVWRAGSDRLTIRNVPIWPNAACSSLRDGVQKQIGVVSDDAAHPGQRIWMARRPLTFTKESCR